MNDSDSYSDSYSDIEFLEPDSDSDSDVDPFLQEINPEELKYTRYIATLKYNNDIDIAIYLFDNLMEIKNDYSSIYVDIREFKNARFRKITKEIAEHFYNGTKKFMLDINVKVTDSLFAFTDRRTNKFIKLYWCYVQVDLPHNDRNDYALQMLHFHNPPPINKAYIEYLGINDRDPFIYSIELDFKGAQIAEDSYEVAENEKLFGSYANKNILNKTILKLNYDYMNRHYNIHSLYKSNKKSDYKNINNPNVTDYNLFLQNSRVHKFSNIF